MTKYVVADVGQHTGAGREVVYVNGPPCGRHGHPWQARVVIWFSEEDGPCLPCVYDLEQRSTRALPGVVACAWPYRGYQ